jgi:transposase
MTGGKRKQQRTKRTRERRVSIRAIRREQVDVHKLARALIALAQDEAAAQAEHDAGTLKPRPRDRS